jgi:hypothetical protein
VIQITFATLEDFIDEHKKYGYPDRSIVRAEVMEDPARPGGYEVVVTSLQRAQILRYIARPEVHEHAEAEQAACLELRKELATELTRNRFEVRAGILGVAEA